MRDREVKVSVSVGCLVAYAGWAASLVVFVIGWAVDSSDLRVLAVMTVAAASTATVRSYFVKQNHLLKEAFEIGRDSMAPVSALRR